LANVTYEGMFLLDSNRYSANTEGVKGEVQALLDRVHAKVLATRVWQDGKLAYAIDGHRKGVHYLVYFEMDSRQLTELERLVKFNESILRHMFIKLPVALIEPMLAMATGKGEVVTTFHDTEITGLDVPVAVETL
jgi:small subunit ribosomal protein S6